MCRKRSEYADLCGMITGPDVARLASDPQPMPRHMLKVLAVVGWIMALGGWITAAILAGME